MYEIVFDVGLFAYRPFKRTLNRLLTEGDIVGYSVRGNWFVRRFTIYGANRYALDVIRDMEC